MAKKEADTKQVIPLNQQLGRCGNCANGDFTQHLIKRILYRKCKRCNELVDIDNGIVARKGEIQILGT